MESLETKTLKYWQLSKAAHGHASKIMTVGDLIDRSNELLENLNPARRVWNLTARMQMQVIEHGGAKKTKKRKVTNVLKFQSR